MSCPVTSDRGGGQVPTQSRKPKEALQLADYHDVMSPQPTARNNLALVTLSSSLHYSLPTKQEVGGVARTKLT